MISRAARIHQRLEILASFSENPAFLDRPFCSPSATAANQQIAAWAKEDNLHFQLDELANVRLRTPHFDPEKKTFVAGSHLDSVVNAGKYDGPLGFLVAYEMLAQCVENNINLPFNLEVIGFSDEEGVRYQSTYLGSSAVAGIFSPDWLQRIDKEGITMDNALKKFGCNPEKIAACAIPAEDWLGYYEVHIEQGPVLQEHQLSVGLVKDIYGQIRIAFRMIGFAGHAGTVPMDMRRDALTGLAAFVTQLEAYALLHKKDLVATVGKCIVSPGASNVIPGEIEATIDLRSHDMELLVQSADHIRSLLEATGKQRGLEIEWKEVQRNPPVYCHDQFNQWLGEAIEAETGTVLSLSSGAGHDGVAISKVAPICMLFVRCKDGISHHPSEYCAPEDIEAALKVSVLFLEKLITYSK